MNTDRIASYARMIEANEARNGNEGSFVAAALQIAAEMIEELEARIEALESQQNADQLERDCKITE
jgi:malate synthase